VAPVLRRNDHQARRGKAGASRFCGPVGTKSHTLFTFTMVRLYISAVKVPSLWGEDFNRNFKKVSHNYLLQKSYHSQLNWRWQKLTDQKSLGVINIRRAALLWFILKQIYFEKSRKTWSYNITRTNEKSLC
jgi:hypothetical protein